MTNTTKKLPRLAQEFLRTPEGRGRIRLVCAFYRWMTEHHLTVAELQPPQIESFLHCPFRRTIKRGMRDHHRRRLLVYLDWLYAKGQLGFDPQCFRRSPRHLPLLAEQFLESLTTIKSSSCKTYRTNLNVFYAWLEENDLQVDQLNRQHLSRWFKQLKDGGLSPGTRRQRIGHVRRYLRWLYEGEKVSAYPDDLVRPEDLPRRPSYLPRPLPLEADLELQLRLAEATCPLQQGLLLMRYTGLRVGELMSLERDCVRTDHKGNRFLKVPLGKLDNERLVPLDDKAIKLIAKLRSRGRRKGRWLLQAQNGTKTCYEQYHRALREACGDMEIPDRMTTHRLRHTYATSLLNGGMSLVGVMRLLGHRSYRMTLTYTAITQETVVKEYYEALTQIEKKYATILNSNPTGEFDPVKALYDITCWLKKTRSQDPGDKRVAQALIRRIDRIRDAIHDWRSPK